MCVSTLPVPWFMANLAQRLKQLRTTRNLTQTRLAELLAISLDDLAGRKESQAPPKIRNHELHRLYQKVDLLSDEDQKALLVVLDSLVKRSDISRVMAD